MSDMFGTEIIVAPFQGFRCGWPFSQGVALGCHVSALRANFIRLRFGLMIVVLGKIPINTHSESAKQTMFTLSFWTDNAAALQACRRHRI